MWLTRKGDFPHNIFGSCKDSLRKVVLGEPWHCFADLRSVTDRRQKENESSFVKLKNPVKFIGILVLISAGAKPYPFEIISSAMNLQIG